MWVYLLIAAALVAGIYVGFGFPGLKGREDRVVTHARRLKLKPIALDWLRGPRR